MTYLVTITRAYRVEAPSEEDAIIAAQELDEMLIEPEREEISVDSGGDRG
jgi:hypothetical protein